MASESGGREAESLSMWFDTASSMKVIIIRNKPFLSFLRIVRKVFFAFGNPRPDPALDRGLVTSGLGHDVSLWSVIPGLRGNSRQNANARGEGSWRAPSP